MILCTCLMDHDVDSKAFREPLSHACSSERGRGERGGGGGGLEGGGGVRGGQGCDRE